MSEAIERYLEMERQVYADLTARSNFSDGSFSSRDDQELVVGSYAQQERYDYERWLFGGITISPDAVALEYGCGPGRMILRLAPRFRRVDGIDISPELIDIAQHRCATLAHPPHLFVTDGQSVPVEPERYDVAYSVICLQHICVHSVRVRILEGLYRALKPGGVLTFQMGYGPGHCGRVDYAADFVDATGTNGAADVTVVHPGEIAADLGRIGFTSMAYALTPTGPGDTHGAWIFFRAMKPGTEAGVAVRASTCQAAGFSGVEPDAVAVERARTLHYQHGLMRHCQALESAVLTLQQDHGQLVQERARTIEAQRQLVEIQAQLEDRLSLAVLERDALHGRVRETDAENNQLRRRLDIDERQLRILRVADRRRVAALIGELVARADVDRLRVGVLGAGIHTQWLLAETPLANLQDLHFFDSDGAQVGRVVAGRVVRSSAEISGAELAVVVVSSLAFQDEMVTFLRSLPLANTRIVCCYPTHTP